MRILCYLKYFKWKISDLMRTASTQSKGNLIKAEVVSCRDGDLFECVLQ